MKGMMTYLIRSKRGVIGTIIGSAAALLISAVLYASHGISLYVNVTLHPEWYFDLAETQRTDPDWKQHYFNLADTFQPEVTAIAVTTLLFLFVCGNAFRFGTANGASRKTITKATFCSAFIIAAMSTVINTLLLSCVIRYSYFYGDEPLYTVIFGPSADAKPGEWPYVSELTPSLEVRDALTYFGILLTLMLIVCAMYALYRRRGMFGILCGTLFLTCTIPVGIMLYTTSGSAGRAIRSLLLHDGGVNYSRNGYLYSMHEPKALTLAVIGLLIAAAAVTVYHICIKRSGIKPVTE